MVRFSNICMLKQSESLKSENKSWDKILTI